MISRKLSLQLTKIVVIVCSWVFIGFLVTLYDHACLNSELSSGYTERWSFGKNLVFNLTAGFLGGTLGSLWLVLYVNEKTRGRSYGYQLLMVIGSFLVIVCFIAITIGMGFVKVESGHWPFTNETATNMLYENLTNPFHLKNIVIWSHIVMLTQLGLQVNDRFGQGLLFALITGKYQKPKKELRTFMFLDLIGSTTIAERLGNEKYYGFIRDFYADITNSIIYNGGKIYQYVGDEIVISWTNSESDGQLDSINCFFDIRKAIESKKENYLDKYGAVPDFKAAVHYGYVTAGEIGIIKRDLTFSGDVLNTTARMMGFCKVYNEKLLISGTLYDSLKDHNSNYQFDKKGEEVLRGKTEEIAIYSVNINN